MILCLKINNYHKKIKFTIETNPKIFLDTRLLLKNDIIKTEVYHKANKFPVNWKSQIRKKDTKVMQHMNTPTSSQVSNCDGVVLEIYLVHKFQ